MQQSASKDMKRKSRRGRSRPDASRSNESGPNDFDFSIVTIHDVTVDPDATWSRETLDHTTWARDTPKAKVISYRYDNSAITHLWELLDPWRLDHLAGRLLNELDQRLGPCEALPEATINGDFDVEDRRRLSQRPIIILAHGYGGLIYERALRMSYESLLNDNRPSAQNFLAHRYQLAILFDTPHFAAGLGEWAIMSGRSLGIRCARTAAQQQWSQKEREFVATISNIQATLSDQLQTQDSSNPTIQIAGCFATLPDKETKLVDLVTRLGSHARVQCYPHTRGTQ
ncbi:srpk [Apiospora marii]|uniref:Srpk n=1 Tax=Apiospora marii TaxID=335849 RepID=A0ABR1R463_9PEZI